VTLVAVAVLILVVVAGVAVSLLTSSSSSSTKSTLTSNTLLKLPAVSAVVQGRGASYATDDLRDLIVRFDPGNGKVEDSLHLAGRPTAMVLASGRLWVADMVDNAVDEVDVPRLDLVRSVPVPKGPSSLAVLGRDLWVTSVVAGDLTPIDLRSGRAGPPVSVAAGAVRVAAGFGSLWVTGTQNILTEVVPTRGSSAPTQHQVSVGLGPIGVATGGGAVWVANAQGATVSQVDPANLQVEATLHSVGADPLSIAVAGDRVFVGSGTEQEVRVVSPAPGSQTLPLDTTPRALVPVGAEVWVAGSNPGRVLSVG
jgi:streptogramin lyase